jgi:hypothetical protein
MEQTEQRYRIDRDDLMRTVMGLDSGLVSLDQANGEGVLGFDKVSQESPLTTEPLNNRASELTVYRRRSEDLKMMLYPASTLAPLVRLRKSKKTLLPLVCRLWSIISIHSQRRRRTLYLPHPTATLESQHLAPRRQTPTARPRLSALHQVPSTQTQRRHPYHRAAQRAGHQHATARHADSAESRHAGKGLWSRCWSGGDEETGRQGRAGAEDAQGAERGLYPPNGWTQGGYILGGSGC